MNNEMVKLQVLSDICFFYAYDLILKSDGTYCYTGDKVHGKNLVNDGRIFPDLDSALASWYSTMKLTDDELVRKVWNIELPFVKAIIESKGGNE